uniref:Uncharacterized protein n=1 Tax=Trypanosoma vivax (strain Y486) TaxID=1055687 RepID=G0TU64_TRYVY|nr:conserved hypothetical protein [Trypanosoma vivax Y486]
MHSLNSHDNQTSKGREMSITWEDELLLRGVWPGSEMVSLLQPNHYSPHNRSEYNSGAPAGSCAILAMVNGYGSCHSSPRSDVKPANVSPLRNLSAKLRSRDPSSVACDENAVGYSSDSGLSSTWSRLLPVSVTSPRVVVPSLLPLQVNTPPPSRGSKEAQPGCALPLLGADVRRMGSRGSEPSHGGVDQEPHDNTSPRALAGNMIPIRDTEVTLGRKSGLSMANTWKGKSSRVNIDRHSSNDGRSSVPPTRPVRSRATVKVVKTLSSSSTDARVLGDGRSQQFEANELRFVLMPRTPCPA